jgi:sec-independent protein translocase protein TatA
LGGLQPMHWVIVIVVLVLLFGSKKLPDAARAVGKSLRIFKSEVKEMQNDGKPADLAAQSEAPSAEQPAKPIESTPGNPQQQS